MRNTQFKKIVSSLEELNTQQFRELKASIQNLEDNEPCSKLLESDYSHISCPHCNFNQTQRWGKRNGLQRYRCKSCMKTFNSLSSTPLANLRKKDKWIKFSECIRDGVSLRKAAVYCGIHRNTAFKWRHRFLDKAKDIKADELSGIVEVDETYFLKSEKGNKNLQRNPRKRGGKAKQRGLSKEQVCVFVGRDRNQNTIDYVFDQFNADNLSELLNDTLSKDVLLCSDSKPVYKRYTACNKIKHGYINLSKGEKVKKEIVHIQNVNAYHSRLKKWMDRFNGVATKYLESYLSWYRELDEFNMDTSPELLLLRAKQGGNYKVQPLIVT